MVNYINKQKANYYKNKHFYANGIDRKDNSVGYTLKNSVSCCIICNRAKNNMSYNDFKNWIEKLKTNIMPA